MPAPAEKKTREWKIEEKQLTPFQKSLIIAAISFVPFFLFIILPYLVRSHITSTLKLDEQVILSTPEHVALVAGGDMLPTFRITIHAFTFHVPKIYTPVQVRSNLAVFHISPRRISRKISIAALDKPPKLTLQKLGILRWFIPNDQLAFLDKILYATFNPIRMMCKAHFYIAEGIGGKVFETEWDANHRAYIFPTSGNSGYIGRIYNINGKGYYEFSMTDEVDGVTLKEWLNLAVKMKPPFGDEPSNDRIATRGASLAQTLRLLEEGEKGLCEGLEFSLNQYYATNDKRWLIPVAAAMEKRGYYSQLIHFYREHAKQAQDDPQQQAVWQSLFDRTLPQILKVEADPHLNQNQIDFYCKNHSEFMIKNVKTKVTLSGSHGDRSFETTLFTNESLHPQSEKVVAVAPPQYIIVRDAQSVTTQILDLEMSD